MSPMVNHNLEGLVAIVSGGASGIGAAITRHIVNAGGRVVIADIQVEQGQALAREVGPDCYFVATDHTDIPSNVNVCSEAVSRFGKLDILCNNAGMLADGPIAEMAPQVVERLLKVNLLGPYLLTQAALPALRANVASKDRSIVFTGSVQSVKGRPNHTAYGMTKHGITGLVKSLALELAGENIRVNSVLPGPTETPLLMASMARAGSIEDWNQTFRSAIPQGRLVLPSDVAAVVGFLCSRHSSSMTGALLPVDGGITAG